MPDSTREKNRLESLELDAKMLEAKNSFVASMTNIVNLSDDEIQGEATHNPDEIRQTCRTTIVMVNALFDAFRLEVERVYELEDLLDEARQQIARLTQ